MRQSVGTEASDRGLGLTFGEMYEFVRRCEEVGVGYDVPVHASIGLRRQIKVLEVRYDVRSGPANGPHGV